ncbi:carboxymuconolactone decarboxylase family protein [Streptomyces sp. NPDC088725]|uniref:carboxymuconolactone decarboxylase family protein n=1 Tax=Streptomyces sp. NPDC088725 TaxID=3365873 RepID=UPI0037FD9386
MSLDELAAALPDYARDLRLNLTSVIGRSTLTPQQLWGTVLACAIASRSPRVLRPLAAEAAARLSPEAYTAAKSTAAVMALSNVFFRTRHLLSDPEYGSLRPGLRTAVPAGHGVDGVDVELWSVAVSAVNGCGACLDAHEQALRRAGVSRETVQEAFKVASVIQAVGTTLDAEAVLAEVGGPGGGPEGTGRAGDA